MPDAPLECRKESRIPIKLFVNLYSPETHIFEVAPSVDISCHGARVTTKNFWKPNLPLSVRSIQGKFFSKGRVVHCQRQEGSFIVGLEMYYPEGNWAAASETATQVLKGHRKLEPPQEQFTSGAFRVTE